MDSRSFDSGPPRHVPAKAFEFVALSPTAGHHMVTMPMKVPLKPAMRSV